VTQEKQEVRSGNCQRCCMLQAHPLAAGAARSGTTTQHYSAALHNRNTAAFREEITVYKTINLTLNHERSFAENHHR
jgi:hypothetical protein